MRKLAAVVVFGATAACTMGCSQDQKVKKFNADPSAEIYSPDPDEEIKEGVYFLASGRVWDGDDPIDQLLVTWIIDGESRCAEAPPMADGRTECGMSIGTADVDVSLFVKDPNGATYQASVGVTSIPATGPTVTISEPSLDTYTVGDKLPFEGTVSDGEDAASALRVWWWSDLDDELEIDLAQDDDGSVIGYYDGLSQGTHVLRLWAEDTSGRANSSEVVVNILPEPAPPLVSIISPEDGSSHEAGTPILFEASIADEHTLPAAMSVEWTSSLDGMISTEHSDDFGEITFTYDGLSEGTHEIILTVTDGDGMTNTERVTISVTAPSDPGGDDTASEG